MKTKSRIKSRKGDPKQEQDPKQEKDEQANKLHVLRITVKVDAAGGLGELRLNGQVVSPSTDNQQTALSNLQSQIRAIVDDSRETQKNQRFAGEFVVDPQLGYSELIKVITACTEHRSDGQLVRLIDKVKIVMLRPEVPGPTQPNDRPKVHSQGQPRGR